MNQTDETAVVMLSAKGRGAIAVILVHGTAAVDVVEKCYIPFGRTKLKDANIGKILFGHWLSRTGEEVVVTRRCENSLEVHCHGGVAAPENICQSLIEQGCVNYHWKDWLVKKNQSPISIAATSALTEAQTEQTASYLITQMQGSLLKKLLQIKQLLESTATESAVAELQILLRRANFGIHLTQPWKIVLAGKVNVGKSSLINTILGYERSIVYNSPGTTRDVVTANTAIDGWPVELIDTAGIREGTETLEIAGIELAKDQIAKADLVLLVRDTTENHEVDSDSLDQLLLENQRANTIEIFNKCDLLQSDQLPEGQQIFTSATTGVGIEQLLEMISQRLVPEVPEIGEPLLFTECQQKRITKTLSLVNDDNLQAALTELEKLIQ